jgi:23S rRNA (uracil1939-C5)-methyltransferase
MTETSSDRDEFVLHIDSLTYGPYGVGRRKGQAIFVPMTAPGDEVMVRIVERRKNYALGEITEIIRPSPSRQTPPCPYFGACGGCQWQHVTYSTQLAAKEKNVEDALRRIGKLEDFELFPIIRSPGEYHYRRRVRLQIDGQKRLGFYRAFSHELIEIDSCLIADPLLDRHLSHLKTWAGELKSSVHEIEIIRGDQSEETVFVGEAERDFRAEDDTVSASFLTRHPEIGGLILFGHGWRRSWGRARISICSGNGIKTEADAETFTQANREANEFLVDQLLGWGEFHDRDRILELYAGAGNFTLPVARRSREVFAVEGNPRSVQNGEINGQSNGLQNIRWICSPVPRATTQLTKTGEKFSKIILNPPRSGAKELEADLSALGAEKIFYVSCNPTTLARDLATLNKRGYKLKRVRPIDLFPHTFHVETLAEVVRA